MVRSTILYGLECWEVDRKIEQNMNVAEMRILRWMSGVTGEDRIKKEYVRDSIGEKRPKKRWLDTIENVMRAAGVQVGDVDDRDK